VATAESPNRITTESVSRIVPAKGSDSVKKVPIAYEVVFPNSEDDGDGSEYDDDDGDESDVSGGRRGRRQPPRYIYASNSSPLMNSTAMLMSPNG
jgi:hypothetical protein